MDAISDAKTGAVQLSQIQTPSVDDLAGLDSDDLLARFDAADNSLASLIELEGHVEALQKRLDEESNICGDEGFLQARGLENIGFTGLIATFIPSLVAEKHNVLISDSYTSSGGDSSQSENDQGGDDVDGSEEILQGFVSAGQLVASLFGANQTEQQNEKLREAIGQIPSQVIQPTAVLILSKGICGSQFQSIGSLHVQAEEAVGQLQSAIELDRKNLVLVSIIIAYRLRPKEIEAFLSDTGVSAMLTSEQSAMLHAAFATQVQIGLSNVAELAQDTLNATSCLDGLKKAEAFDDADIELAAELKALKGGSAPTTSLNSLDQAISTLESLNHDYPKLVKRISGAYCS